MEECLSIFNPGIVFGSKSKSDKIILTERQKDIIIELDKRGSYVNLIRSPANIGKTFFSCIYFALNVMKYSGIGETNFIVTYDTRTFANTICGLLKEIFLQLGEDVNLHERTTSVALSNGSTLSYISACSNQPESKTRGTNLSFVLIDEISKINSDLVYALISRLRNNPHRKLIATTNADSMISKGSTEFNWVYEQFFRDDKWKKIDPKYLNVVYLTKQDSYVNEEKMEEYHTLIKTFLPDHLVDNFINDRFNAPTNLVYHEIADRPNKCFVKNYVDSGENDWYIGIDYGFFHRCGIVIARRSSNCSDNEPLVVVESKGLVNSNTTDIILYLEKMARVYNFDLRDVEIACDPSSPLVIDELISSGLNCNKACNKVNNGINLINILARKKLIKIIKGNNKDLETEILSFTNERLRSKVHDDVCDALRYLCLTFFEFLGRDYDVEKTNKFLQHYFG